MESLTNDLWFLTMEMLGVPFLLQSCVLVSHRFRSLIYTLCRRDENEVYFHGHFQEHEPRIYRFLSIVYPGDFKDSLVFKIASEYLKLRFYREYCNFVNSSMQAPNAGFMTIQVILTRHCKEGSLLLLENDYDINIPRKYRVVDKSIGPINMHISLLEIFLVCEKLLDLHRSNTRLFSKVFDNDSVEITVEGNLFIKKSFDFFDVDDDKMLDDRELNAMARVIGTYPFGFGLTLITSGKYEFVDYKMTLKGLKDFLIDRYKIYPAVLLKELQTIDSHMIKHGERSFFS